MYIFVIIMRIKTHNLLTSIPIITYRLLQLKIPLDVVQKIILLTYYDDVNISFSGEYCTICGSVKRIISHKCDDCGQITCSECELNFKFAYQLNSYGITTPCNKLSCIECFKKHFATNHDKSKCYMCTLYPLG